MQDTSTKAKHAHLWKRDEFDWYVEPEWCADLLFAAEHFNESVFDPACGAGNICRAAMRAGILNVGGSDICKRWSGKKPDWWFGQIDFLKEDDHWFLSGTRNIICNPPFYRAKGTEDFARRAHSLATGKIAIFASLPFLASQRRASGLFAESPPTRVWILAERPSCPPGEALAAGLPAKGGTEDWCWLVWDKAAAGDETQLGWLRRGSAFEPHAETHNQ